jgi:thiamine pyrophosphate-dependent acetolactate synthase large subunit-like protein
VSAPRPERRALVAALLARRGEALVVTGLGTPTWDVAAAGDSAANLTLWGGMGLAVPVALGLALAVPERRVVAITGDGEMLMGLGSLAVVAAERPANLAILVLDNERFSETGAQAGLTARGVDLAAVARGAGIAGTMTLASMADAEEAAALLFARPGPAFVCAKVSDGGAPPVHPERHGATVADRFRAALGR